MLYIVDNYDKINEYFDYGFYIKCVNSKIEMGRGEINNQRHNYLMHSGRRGGYGSKGV